MVKMFYRSSDESSNGRRELAYLIGKVWMQSASWTSSCSGCTELGDYNGNSHFYAYDEKAQCHIGAGCQECGYKGKRRVSMLLPVPYKADQRRLNARLRDRIAMECA